MKAPTYEWKLLPELLWAAGVAALIFALSAVSGIGDVTDWKTWAVSVGTGAARAAAGAALAILVPKPTPTE